MSGTDGVAVVGSYAYVADYYGGLEIYDFYGAGVEETPNGEWRMANGGPTILSGAGVRCLASSVVFDAMGRRVRNPKPGVYFVREAQAQAQAQAQVVRRVVIAR
jgi:hypothetical protein